MHIEHKGPRGAFYGSYTLAILSESGSYASDGFAGGRLISSRYLKTGAFLMRCRKIAAQTAREHLTM